MQILKGRTVQAKTLEGNIVSFAKINGFKFFQASRNMFLISFFSSNGKTNVKFRISILKFTLNIEIDPQREDRTGQNSRGQHCKVC